MLGALKIVSPLRRRRQSCDAATWYDIALIAARRHGAPAAAALHEQEQTEARAVPFVFLSCGYEAVSDLRVTGGCAEIGCQRHDGAGWGSPAHRLNADRTGEHPCNRAYIIRVYV